MVSVNDPFIPPEGRTYTPDISQGLFARVMREYGSPWADQADSLYALIVSQRQYPGRWLAIAVREHGIGSNRDSVLWRNNTKSWTNARTVRDPSLTNWSIIVDPLRGSEYVKYASVADSLRDGMYRVTDPTYRYVREGRTTIAKVIAIWSEGDSDDYAATVARLVTTWQAEDVTMAAGDDERFAWVPDTSEYGYPQGAHGRNGKPVDYLIVHVTEGTDSLAWLNGNHESSAHYLTNRDATPRAQMVREADAAWCAGNRDYNERGINIEFERFARDEWTGREYQAAAATCYPILKRNNIPLAFLGRNNANRRGIIGHEHVPDPDGTGWGGAGNHTDPGSKFDWPRFMAELRALEPPVTPQTPPDSLTFPETGQTLSGGFLRFWEAFGGLPIFGYPLTGELEEDGMTVQYFERAVFEWHPGSDPSKWDVMLRRIGAEVLAAKEAA